MRPGESASEQQTRFERKRDEKNALLATPPSRKQLMNLFGWRIFLWCVLGAIVSLAAESSVAIGITLAAAMIETVSAWTINSWEY